MFLSQLPCHLQPCKQYAYDSHSPLTILLCYKEAVQLCLAHPEGAFQANGDTFARAPGYLVAASEPYAALQA